MPIDGQNRRQLAGEENMHGKLQHSSLNIWFNIHFLSFIFFSQFLVFSKQMIWDNSGFCLREDDCYSFYLHHLHESLIYHNLLTRLSAGHPFALILVLRALDEGRNFCAFVGCLSQLFLSKSRAVSAMIVKFPQSKILAHIWCSSVTEMQSICGLCNQTRANLK